MFRKSIAANGINYSKIMVGKWCRSNAKIQKRDIWYLNLGSCHLHIGPKVVYLHNWVMFILWCIFYPCVVGLISNPFLTFLLNAERSMQKLLNKNVVPVAAVVIMACNRPDYLERTVESILKYGSRLNHLFPKSEMIYSTLDSQRVFLLGTRTHLM